MISLHVYRAISRVTKELSLKGIPKRHTNGQDHYSYRSIDDLLRVLAPLLAKYSLCVLPRVLERNATELSGTAGERLGKVVLRVAFDLISARDGSKHTIEAYGEASDLGDKGTSKAAAAAFKTAILQAFCIPVDAEDPDASPTPHLSTKLHRPAPPGGWDAWVNNVLESTRSCESEAALRMIQRSHRDELLGLSRERRDLYEEVGGAFSARFEALTTDVPAPSGQDLLVQPEDALKAEGCFPDV